MKSATPPEKEQKPVKGTTIEDGRVTLKRGYKFIQLSDTEVAVAKVTRSPARKGSVSTRSYIVDVTGGYECKCTGVIGSCRADIMADPFTHIVHLSCLNGARPCRRGCKLSFYYAGY